MLTLDGLNAIDAAGFATALGDMFEHAPWMAAEAASRRPFAHGRDLHAA